MHWLISIPISNPLKIKCDYLKVKKTKAHSLDKHWLLHITFQVAYGTKGPTTVEVSALNSQENHQALPQTPWLPLGRDANQTSPNLGHYVSNKGTGLDDPLNLFQF